MFNQYESHRDVMLLGVSFSIQAICKSNQNIFCSKHTGEYLSTTRIFHATVMVALLVLEDYGVEATGRIIITQ